jgi:hypothetical protein
MSRTVKIGKSKRKDGAAPLVSSSHAASDAAPVPVPTSPSLAVDVEDDEDVRADDDLQLTPPSSKANKAIELMSRAVRTATAAGDGDGESASASASGSGAAGGQQPALAVDMSSIHPSLAHLTLEMGELEEEEDVDIYTVNDLRREKAEEKKRRKAAEKQRRVREKEMRLKHKQPQSTAAASASEEPSLSPSPSSAATAANGLKSPPPPAAAADDRQRKERRFNAMWTAIVAVVIIIAAILLWQYGGSDRLIIESPSGGSGTVPNGQYILNLSLWTDVNCSLAFNGTLAGGYQLSVASYTHWPQLSPAAANCTLNPLNSSSPVIKSGMYECSNESLIVREWTSWSDCRNEDIAQAFSFASDGSIACNPGLVYTTDEAGKEATRGELYAKFDCGIAQQNATTPK